MKLACRMLVLGLVIVPLASVVGCGGGSKQRSTVDSQINTARLLIAELKKTFDAGQTQLVSDSDDPRAQSGRQDMRMGIVAMIIQEKVRASVIKKVDSIETRDAALKKLAEISDYLDSTILPQFQTAIQSKKPEDARALSPLMDELDKQLVELDEMLG